MRKMAVKQMLVFIEIENNMKALKVLKQCCLLNPVVNIVDYQAALHSAVISPSNV